jgi:peptidoglycan/LPS O-acetylase OafA/YrhL
MPLVSSLKWLAAIVHSAPSSCSADADKLRILLRRVKSKIQIGAQAEINPRQRNDIQVLRGFAVLAVLIYHAKLVPLQAGYLGVDVFFVLSGFLITRLVKQGIERGDFSFSAFYFRRAKRLLPAAYTVFLVTALLAPFFLTSIELKEFSAQMVGAVTFSANIVLWRQSGYFGGAAGLKPLLHVWSLSLEEQYYFILPATMYFFPRRLWKVVAMGSLLASFTLCLILVNKTAATFYLLPTREWELAIGSVGAIVTVPDRLKETIRYCFWPALIALLVLPVVTIFPFHPGPDALIICVATLVIVLREHPMLSAGVFMRGMGKIGDISYALYLVHWPIFAFLNNAFIGGNKLSDLPIMLRVGLFGLALLLAFLLNRYVEEPIRRANIRYSPRIVLRVVLASFLLILTTIGIARSVARVKDYTDFRQANQGMSSACDFRSEFLPIPECRTSNAPVILVWGDSFAMHLVPGILGTTDAPPAIVQATRGECGPLLGVAPVERVFATGADKSWAKRCIAFNDSVIRYLEKAESIDVVVLSSPFTQYIDNRDYRLLTKGENERGFVTIDAGFRPALAGLSATVDRIRSLGKKVIVVGPPPQAGFDVGRCLERVHTKILTIGSSEKCKIDKETYETSNADVLRFIDMIPGSAHVDVVDFKSYLCGKAFCETDIDGTPLYMDSAHLSREGSVLLGNKTLLLDRITRGAR